MNELSSESGGGCFLLQECVGSGASMIFETAHRNQKPSEAFDLLPVLVIVGIIPPPLIGQERLMQPLIG